MVVRVLLSLVPLAAIACGPGTSRESEAEPAIDADIAIVAFSEPLNAQPRAPLFSSIECPDPMALESPAADPIAPPWVFAGSGPRHASAAGVRVAIVDVGFDGYEGQLGLRLPERVEIRSFRADGLLETGTDHGTEASAIVHAVAPEAELTLVVVRGVQDLRLVAEFLVERQITVVSSSIGFVHAGAGDGTGPVSDALSPALEAGTAWINGVGNWGLQPWGANNPSASRMHRWRAPTVVGGPECESTFTRASI